jgi:hypothetical protein
MMDRVQVQPLAGSITSVVNTWWNAHMIQDTTQVNGVSIVLKKSMISL